MSGQSEPRVPSVTITLELENTRVGFRIDATPADTERILEWLRADPLRWALITVAFALGQPHKGDVAAGEEKLAELAAALAQVPTERTPPSLAEALRVRAPMGSFQNQELRRVVDAGESGRAWLVWALARVWEPLDRTFEEALHVVAKAEGLMPDDSAEDDAPANGEDGSDG